MIEIFRKGFRLDIPSSQIVTFKKSQNLNGIQSRYSFSNNFSIDKTANNIKLLNLPELPVGKVQTLQNGYIVDVVINGSIFLKNQKLKITKESQSKIELYLLFSEANLFEDLKSSYIAATTQEYLYKKTIEDFEDKAIFDLNDPPIAVTAIVKTQSDSGVYVIEEMPQLFNVPKLLSKIFGDLGYTVVGDFGFADYFVAPNSGIYEVYSSGDGFTPKWDLALTAWDFVSQTLQFFNSYATFDDQLKTVTINQWSNIGDYKTRFADYSKYYTEYQDYSFQSKTAKRNLMTYSDSGNTFNSFFSDNQSDQDSATYLASKFGSGSTNYFDDAEFDDFGVLVPRANGEVGNLSAVRIYKLSAVYNNDVYFNGVVTQVQSRRAVSVSMRTVYEEFHRQYTKYILSPIIQNIKFRYDSILATDFDITRPFFIEQLASYWLPLEIGFSTKQDVINLKAMLIRERKAAPIILNNFNTVLLNFREKVIFPKSFLLSMYPMPPNVYPWDELIVKNYNGALNRLFINDVFIPSEALPQAFSLSELNENSIVIESDLPGDIFANTLSDSLYIQAVDTNGGVSNDAYINLKHTGIAHLESNFELAESPFIYQEINIGSLYLQNILSYVVGTKPNLNLTIDSVEPVRVQGATATEAFNLVNTIEDYSFLKFVFPPFKMRIYTFGQENTDYVVRLMFQVGSYTQVVREWTAPADSDVTYNVSTITNNYNIAVPSGTEVKAFFMFLQRNDNSPRTTRMRVEIENFKLNISTTKTL